MSEGRRRARPCKMLVPMSAPPTQKRTENSSNYEIMKRGEKGKRKREENKQVKSVKMKINKEA